MTLLDREFVGDFFRALFVLLCLLALVDMVDVLLSFYDAIFGAVDNGLYWVMLYFLCRMPGNLVQAVVFAVAAAILWVVARKSRQNEILAWLAGGISPLRLAVPFLGASLAISVATLLVSEYLVGPAQTQAELIDRQRLNPSGGGGSLGDNQVYLRGASNRYYLIESYDSAAEIMNRPIIVQMNDGGTLPQWQLAAESANLVAQEGYWRFTEAVLRRFDPDGLRVVEFETYATVTDKELALPMEADLEHFLGAKRNPQLMSISDLARYVRLVQSQGKVVTQHVVQLHTRLALPLAAVVVALVVCGHIIHPRSRGVLVGLGGGLGWVLAYYGVFLLFQNLGDRGLVPAAVAGWFANVVFAIVGVAILLRGSRA